MKLVNVTFKFDPETEMISDVHCTVDGVEKKKKTTTRKKDVAPVELEAEAKITLEANKIVFNNKAIDMLQPSESGRVSIKWIQESNVMIPIMGTDVAFGEEGAGNKLTKSNTMAYKGKANAVLAELDNEFTLAPHKDGIFKLVPLNKTEVTGKPAVKLENIIKQAEETEPVLIVESDTTTDLDPLTFTL